MKHRIVFSFILCAFSSLIGSEKITRQCIVARVDVNNQNSQEYEVKDVRKIDINDILTDREPYGSNIYYEYPARINYDNIKKVSNTRLLSVTSNAMIIDGSKTNQYTVQFIGDSYTFLQEKLKEANKKYRKDELESRNFEISLINKEVTQGVSFFITEDQFQQIVSQKSYMTKVVACFGIAGLAAFFIYYFNLHSKGMALLGRG